MQFKKSFAFLLVNYKLVHFYSSASQQIISTQKQIFLEVFLMTPLIRGLNENFWYMASSLYIPFILSATCLFRLVLVWKACMTSSRNCHGLLKAKETKKIRLNVSFATAFQRGGSNRAQCARCTRPYKAPATTSTTRARAWLGRRRGEGEREV